MWTLRKAENLKKLGKQGFFEKVNLMREAEIKKWIKDSVKKSGTFRSLINNSAIDPRTPIEKRKQKIGKNLFPRI
tara:strand:- start:330 stop:554 length:225 start_codon:yes stop_codon:yes gene_type:complete